MYVCTPVCKYAHVRLHASSYVCLLEPKLSAYEPNRVFLYVTHVIVSVCVCVLVWRVRFK
jgi:hypothetical protein